MHIVVTGLCKFWTDRYVSKLVQYCTQRSVLLTMFVVITSM
jgi:hypothetical protein